MPTRTEVNEEARSCPHCLGPMTERISRKVMTDRAGEPHVVGEVATYICEWCEHRIYD